MRTCVVFILPSQGRQTKVNAMISVDTFRKLALAFPEATEEPHFEKTSFRVKKKIFATYDAVKNRACVKLSASDQDIFTSSHPLVIFPLDNKWGKQGWTLIELRKIKKELFTAVLTSAYREVAPVKLIQAMNESKTKQ